MYDRKENDPVGYVYKADVYCDVCIPAIVWRRFVGPAATALIVPLPDKETAWEWVQRLGRVMGVDVNDERTYDSGDFPKVVLTEHAQDIYCGLCREPLIPDDETKGRWLP